MSANGVVDDTASPSTVNAVMLLQQLLELTQEVLVELQIANAYAKANASGQPISDDPFRLRDDADAVGVIDDGNLDALD